MHPLNRALITLTGAISLALWGCTAGPRTETIVDLAVSHSAYNQDTLVSEATLIIEGEVRSTEFTVLVPRHEGGTPEVDPALGLSGEARERVLSDAKGVPSTLVTVYVTAKHRGADVWPRQDVVVVQSGGHQGPTWYRSESEQLLEVGDRYLLFAKGSSLDGAYAIVGGSAGAYRENPERTFTAVDPELAPFDTLTPDQVNELSQ